MQAENLRLPLFLGGAALLLAFLPPPKQATAKVLVTKKQPNGTVKTQVVTVAFDYGRPDKDGISRDPALLLPSFAVRLQQLFNNLRARGFDPMLFEGYRTPERAKQLDKKGTGIADSMHSYGAAADIISASKLWNYPSFFTALGQEAEKIGLTWGGRFQKHDLDHVQAVTVAQQPKFRALAVAQRDLFVTSAMGVG